MTIKSQTIFDIIKEKPKLSNFQSQLVKRTNALLLKPINEFEIEDFRILLSQNIYPEILFPFVLPILQIDILSEGDFYKGDLLSSILDIDFSFWMRNLMYLQNIIKLLQDNLAILNQSKVQYLDFYQKSLNYLDQHME